MCDLYHNMLDKSFRKRLLSQDWEDIMEHNSNPSQTWTRLRDRANRSIRDLILLAKKLPSEKQAEIFNQIQVDELVSYILKRIQLESITSAEAMMIGDWSDARRTTLAYILVWRGIDVCISKYKSLMIDTPNLAKPTISHLEQAVHICRDIAYKTELKERDIGTEKLGLFYLFDWQFDRRGFVGLQYNNRFKEFIMKKFDMAPELGPTELSGDGKEMRGTCRDLRYDLLYHKDEEKHWWHFIIRLNDDKTATFKAFDENNNERATISLIVKQEHNSLCIYEKRK